MRTRILTVVLALGAAGLASAGQYAQPQNQPRTVPRITMEEFKKLHAEDAIVAVDVRSAEAYRAGHIPDAISVPLDHVQEHAARLKAEKKPIVTYCA